MDFGDRLRITRKGKNREVKEIAEKTGASNRTIYSYERGEREPSLNFVVTYLEAFPDINKDYLIFGTGEPFVEYGKSDGLSLEERVKSLEEEMNRMQGKFDKE